MSDRERFILRPSWRGPFEFPAVVRVSAVKSRDWIPDCYGEECPPDTPAAWVVNVFGRRALRGPFLAFVLDAAYCNEHMREIIAECKLDAEWREWCDEDE